MVSEHIIDIHKYFETISNNLNNDGFYLTEVPDINKYQNSINLFTSLHVNHYNEFCIKKLAGYYNLTLIKIVKENYSHYQGITFIFQKKSNNRKLSIQSKVISPSYLRNIKKKYQSSINFLKKDKVKINKIILNNEKKTVLWGASEFLHLYFDKLIKNLTLVDVNDEKVGKYENITVYNRNIINKIFEKILLIVIMTPNKIAKKNILKYLNSFSNFNQRKIKIIQIGL